MDEPVGDLHADLLHASCDSLAVHAAKTRLYSGYGARMLERRSVRAGGLRSWWLLVLRPAWISRAQYCRPARLARRLARFSVLCTLAAFGVFVANVRLAERTGWLRVEAR